MGDEREGDEREGDERERDESEGDKREGEERAGAEREEKEREGDHLTTAKEQEERANIHDPCAVGYQVRQQRWGFTRPVGRSGMLLLLAYRVVLSVSKQRLVPN